MKLHLRPEIGSWYRSMADPMFKVIALDEDDDSIEIQYFDGDIQELDLDSWQRMEIEAVEEPEDWSGPFDDLEQDDLGYDDTGQNHSLHSNPLDEIE